MHISTLVDFIISKDKIDTIKSDFGTSVYCGSRCRARRIGHNNCIEPRIGIRSTVAPIQGPVYNNYNKFLYKRNPFNSIS